ncbi:MFS transporter [Massilia orientalis]|uniref:MFS transporter n=1 Tax=Massilia orientalis TaxID=3050128 RepID=A0ACC7MH52_9BURK|nr:MFS transporter [Massilia sp. YIM B02787]
MSRAFRSLSNFNYRLWAAGALVSNIGTWMQRTAQDWLVLTELTHHNASAVGTVMALQFGPQLLLLPWTGWAADHVDQRKLMMITQTAMGTLALALGAMTLTGVVALWHVYVFAFLFGCASAFDAPVRQTFVAHLVGDADLPNAVALNSTSFNAARMIGPAAAGLLIAGVGTGWAFVVNGLSYVGILCSLAWLRKDELHPRAPGSAGGRGMLDGVRYVWKRPDLMALLGMLFLIATFGLNFPIFIGTMAVSVFHTDARGYSLLSSTMAVGSVVGALLAARREHTRFRALVVGAGVFGAGCALAAVSPGYLWFAAALALTGVAALTFTNTSNSLLQLSTEPAMRGRVMALRLGIALGTTPIGAPIVGWVADHAGPRWALGVAAASGFAALAVGMRYLAVARQRGDGLIR